MAEFLGGEDLDHATAIYVSAVGPRSDQVGPPAEPARAAHWLERGWDVARSLWDRRALLADLDLEHVHFEKPFAVLSSPDRPFQLQAPLVAFLKTLLKENGIAPLHVLSGRGHHLVWSVPRDSPTFGRLSELGSPALVDDDSATPFAPWAGRPGRELEAAFLGMGMVLEEVAHRAIRRCPVSDVPVELTAVEPGSGPQGREIVSLDLSEYGDPLETRTVRVPFSPYLKMQRQATGRLAAALPDLFAIPWEGDLAAGLALMRDPQQVGWLAERASASVPDAAAGTERLLESYRASKVAEAHRWFYAQRMHPPEAWPDTYDRTPLAGLPECARHALDDVEGALLTPAGIQLVARVFLALGWHPRHVAGLIRSRWERGENRAREWSVYSPARRADFYVRLFTTAFVAGLDDLVSFNCRSQGERGACVALGCTRNLLELSRSLLEGRRHDRLAGRPVHGLLLPDGPPGLPGGDP